LGEVYKARDNRLDRTVAIKVLPPDLSGDPERRARFEREAKTVAGLSHPHICPLFDVGDHDGAMVLVMQHLAGQTLAERLERGPLSLEQALTVATEIADALSAAHRQGVIYRDLKPGNVMLTTGGGLRQDSPQAKLLDFGLAAFLACLPLAALPHQLNRPSRPRHASASLRIGGWVLRPVGGLSRERPFSRRSRRVQQRLIGRPLRSGRRRRTIWSRPADA
jgi:serine/threonine protein kinase